MAYHNCYVLANDDAEDLCFFQLGREFVVGYDPGCVSPVRRAPCEEKIRLTNPSPLGEFESTSVGCPDFSL